ncbi:BQ5605_C003g02099 [Microbotryum silenes-dioicae]|uniref:BQ5605_C003g02099 protein n=1 Tax=Microbotryum silenes-dioicae TaxID=796604 RepID=A0A2X0MVB3_9BASI|nr:BQ5605_C003g02099 [Microbotryum silenes-dioicae]
MITKNLSQTFYLARRPGLPWTPLRSRAAVPKSATVVLATSGRGELTVADGTLLPTFTTYRLGAASMR